MGLFFTFNEVSWNVIIVNITLTMHRMTINLHFFVPSLWTSISNYGLCPLIKSRDLSKYFSADDFTVRNTNEIQTNVLSGRLSSNQCLAPGCEWLINFTWLSLKSHHQTEASKKLMEEISQLNHDRTLRRFGEADPWRISTNFFFDGQEAKISGAASRLMNWSKKYCHKAAIKSCSHFIIWVINMRSEKCCGGI